MMYNYSKWEWTRFIPFLLYNGGGVIVSKLTPKQQAFVDEYLIDLNATQAAIRAGYSEKTARSIGQENLTKLVIKKAIDERMAEKQKNRIASQDEILETLTRALREELTEEVVLQFEDGHEIVRKRIAVKDRIKAAELLGKRYGSWTDKLDIKGELGVTIVDDIEDEEE